MRINDLLVGPGTTPAETTPVRVRELLPATGISIGPPSAEDRVEISPLAHVLLQASDQLADDEDLRVEQLHAAYLRGRWEADPERMASRMVDSMVATGRENRSRSALTRSAG